MRAAWLALAGCGRLDFAASQIAGDAEVDAAMPAGAAAYWPLNESSWANGGPYDATGNDNKGTPSGGVAPAQDPMRGWVASFPGDPSCITVPDAPSLHMTTAVTMSAWVQPAQLSPSSFGVISKRTDYLADNEYSLFIWADTGTSNLAYVDIDAETDRMPAPYAFADGAWHQVTATYDGARPAATRIGFFIDGAHVADLPEDSAVIARPSAEPDLRLGCLPIGKPGQSLVGRLSDVALWPRALAAAEIADWYALTKR